VDKIVRRQKKNEMKEQSKECEDEGEENKLNS
jgi:hypothetical protein